MTNDQILKTDLMGRVHRPRAQREAIVDEFERSGVPARPFAEMHGIKYQTLANWIQKRKAKREKGLSVGIASQVSPTGFFEAVVGSSANHNNQGLKIELPGGAVVKMTDISQASLVCELLRTLNKVEQKLC
ncbi:MAG: helix-turn-helix domain-containing protein [Verrucomicrobiota bacterium]|nr:helix-turn-helix domain-containing protein [Verrucomicrobiota bacterium]